MTLARPVRFLVILLALLLPAAAGAQSGGPETPGAWRAIRFGSGRMLVDLPAGYAVTRRGMTDFTVYRFAPQGEGEAKTRGILGIYVGFAPNFDPQEKEGEEGVTAVKGRIGDVPVTWLRWTEEKEGETVLASETLVRGFFKAREPTKGPQPASPTLHFFIRGPDAGAVALLERCAGTFRDAKASGPGTGGTLWEYAAGGAVAAAAAVFDGKVCFGSADGKVTCLEARSGKVAWEADAGAAVAAAPAFADGTVVVAVSNGTLLGFDASTGRKAWAFDAGAPAGSCGPAVAGGKVFAGTAAGVLHAVEAREGRSAWRASWEGDAVAAAAVSGGQVVVCTAKGIVAGLDPATGAKAWEKDMGVGTDGAPAILGGRIVVPGADGRIRCVIQGTGETFWEASFAAAGSPALHGDPRIAFAFLGVRDGRAVCLDANSGRLQAAFESGSPGGSPALVLAGGAPHLVTCGGGKVRCLSGDALKEAWRSDLGVSGLAPPVAAGGRVFAGSAEGRFFCLEAGDADGWPQAGGGPERDGTNPLLAR